jgi:hypothetical protein
VEEHRSFVFERNIVLTNNGKVVSPPWLKVDSWCDYNLYWDLAGNALDFAGISLGQWMATGKDLHSVNAAPGFRDAKGYDFTLAPGSPALAIGFEPIDISRAGLYGPPEWVAGPKEE